MLDIDKKSDTLHNLLPDGDLLIYRFDEFVTEGTRNPRTRSVLYEQVKDCILGLKGAHPDVRTVVLDSATTLTSGVMLAARDHFGRPDMSKSEWDDYNITLNLVTKVVVVLKAIGCNVIINAHEDTTVDLEGTKSGAPAFYGKLATIVPGHMQELVHSRIQNSRNGNTYVWETKAGPFFDARTTLDLPASVPQDYSVFFPQETTDG